MTQPTRTYHSAALYRKDTGTFADTDLPTLRKLLRALPDDARLMPTPYGTLECYTAPPDDLHKENSWHFATLDMVTGDVVSLSAQAAQAIPSIVMADPRTGKIVHSEEVGQVHRLQQALEPLLRKRASQLAFQRRQDAALVYNELREKAGLQANDIDPYEPDADAADEADQTDPEPYVLLTFTSGEQERIPVTKLQDEHGYVTGWRLARPLTCNATIRTMKLITGEGCKGDVL